MTAAPKPPATKRNRSAGQILVMFTMSAGLLFAVLAVVVDVGNIWNNSLHTQHAAEAAALAGVPYMPGDFATASSKAIVRRYSRSEPRVVRRAPWPPPKKSSKMSLKMSPKPP